MNLDAGRRALDAAEDLVDILRLAHSAVQRIEKEIYGPALKEADEVSQSLHRARRLAEVLRAEVERLVREAPAAHRPTTPPGSGSRPAH
jgi:hypothetical protein